MTKKYYITTYILLVYQPKLSAKQTKKRGQQSFLGGEAVILLFLCHLTHSKNHCASSKTNLGNAAWFSSQFLRPLFLLHILD